MIKSVYQDQSEILEAITSLYGIDRLCVDMTYGNGSFYKKLDSPKFIFDSDESLHKPVTAFSYNLPLPTNSVDSLIYDPPFLTYIKQARDHNSIMGKRFGGYWSYEELQSDYTKTIIEAYRVLKKKGIMIVKCQDIIHNHKMHCTHANIINWCEGYFRLKDLYILPAKSRMPIPATKGVKPKKQKHARIFHSYFLVFEK